MSISQITTYTGETPNKITQTANEFHAACDTVNDYQLNTLVPEMITFSGQANALASEVSANAQIASSAANFLGNWSSQSGAATVPTQVYHDSKYWNLLEDIANISTSEPGVSSDWAEAAVVANPDVRIVSVSKTAAYTILYDDLSKFINCSGTWTLSLDPAASIGSGWHCYVKNNGTGDITIDPDSTETIDGLTSFVMYPGESRLILCNGTEFTSLVLKALSMEITDSGTWIKPPGYSAFNIKTYAGGGGGKRKTIEGGSAPGGGGGGMAELTIESSAISSETTVTIGAGGAGETYSTSAQTGGDTSFGSLVKSYGGTGGGTGGDSQKIQLQYSTTYGSLYKGGQTNQNSYYAISGIFGGGAGAQGGNYTSSTTTRYGGPSIHGGGGGGATDYYNNNLYGWPGGATGHLVTPSSTHPGAGEDSTTHGGSGGAGRVSDTGSVKGYNGGFPSGGGGGGHGTAGGTIEGGDGADGCIRILGIV